MRVYIKSSDHSTQEIKISADQTVMSLKSIIERLIGVPISEQSLHSEDYSELLNEKILSDYNIQNLSCISLISGRRVRSLSLEPPLTATISNMRRYSIDVCSRNDPFVVFFEKCRNNDLNYLTIKLEENPELGKIYSNEGWAAIHYAGFSGNSELLKILFSYDADVNMLTLDQQWTCLHLVCIQGHISALNELLSHKDLTLDIEVNENSTALHCACLNGTLKIVDMMLKAKANCMIEDKLGQLPVDLASTREIKEILGKYMGKSEEFPEFFEGPINCHRFFKDLKAWGVLRQGEGTFTVYKDQNSFARKNNPVQIYDLKTMKEIKRCKSTLFNKNQSFFHMISARNGERHLFYSDSEEIANFWVKNMFASLLYQQSHSKKLAQSELLLSEFPCTPGIDFFKFEIIRQIGTGSFAVVHLVKKKDTSDLFALKSMSKKPLMQKNFLKYAITESRILSVVVCPFIIRLHFCFKTPRSLYMVLDYCPNGSLAGLLAILIKLSEHLARIYIAELIIAIEYLHSLNVLYRDLKPENILIDKNLHIKLIDFGLSKESIRNDALSRSFCGTPAYLSPEMLSRNGVSKKADIYGIGCVLFELLAGYPPYYSSEINVLLKRISKGNLKFARHISSTARDLISKLMDRQPEQRPELQDIQEHEFFAGINWSELRAGKVPVIEDVGLLEIKEKLAI